MARPNEVIGDTIRWVDGTTRYLYRTEWVYTLADAAYFFTRVVSVDSNPLVVTRIATKNSEDADSAAQVLGSYGQTTTGTQGTRLAGLKELVRIEVSQILGRFAHVHVLEPAWEKNIVQDPDTIFSPTPGPLEPLDWPAHPIDRHYYQLPLNRSRGSPLGAPEPPGPSPSVAQPGSPWWVRPAAADAFPVLTPSSVVPSARTTASVPRKKKPVRQPKASGSGSGSGDDRPKGDPPGGGGGAFQDPPRGPVTGKPSTEVGKYDKEWWEQKQKENKAKGKDLTFKDPGRLKMQQVSDKPVSEYLAEERQKELHEFKQSRVGQLLGWLAQGVDEFIFDRRPGIGRPGSDVAGVSWGRTKDGRIVMELGGQWRDVTDLIGGGLAEFDDAGWVSTSGRHNGNPYLTPEDVNAALQSPGVPSGNVDQKVYEPPGLLESLIPVWGAIREMMAGDTAEGLGSLFLDLALGGLGKVANKLRTGMVASRSRPLRSSADRLGGGSRSRVGGSRSRVGGSRSHRPRMGSERPGPTVVDRPPGPSPIRPPRRGGRASGSAGAPGAARSAARPRLGPRRIIRNRPVHTNRPPGASGVGGSRPGAQVTTGSNTQVATEGNRIVAQTGTPEAGRPLIRNPFNPPDFPYQVDPELSALRGQFGYTSLDTRDVFVAGDLSRYQLRETLWHEWVHRALTPAGSGPIATTARRMRIALHDTSAFVRGAEEVLAEGLATWNPIKALDQPFARGEAGEFVYRINELGWGDAIVLGTGAGGGYIVWRNL